MYVLTCVVIRLWDTHGSVSFQGPHVIGLLNAEEGLITLPEGRDQSQDPSGCGKYALHPFSWDAPGLGAGPGLMQGPSDWGRIPGKMARPSAPSQEGRRAPNCLSGCLRTYLRWCWHQPPEAWFPI